MGGVLAILRRPIVMIALVAFGAAAAVGAWIIRPIHVGAVGFDAAASVLYFQRMASGARLEAFVGATPKPLLTAVDGTAYEIFHDWRVVSWLAIGAYALGIALTAALAFRVAGRAAGAFAAVGLVGSAGLLLDVDLAYAVSWALCTWAIAGLLVTQARPRFALAGLVLGLGALARFETLIVVACAGAAITISILVLRRNGRPVAPVRAALPVLLGLVALPIQAIHDWILTGDPIYSERVPIIGSLGTPLVGVTGAIRFIIAHYAGEPLLIVLAAIGLVALIAERRWAIALGVLALGPGIGAFMIFLGLSKIYLSPRYVTPADLALTFAAAIGVASIRIHLPNRITLGRWSPGLNRVVLAGVGGLLALLVVRPFGPIDGPTRVTIRQNAAEERDIASALPAITAAIADDPAAHIRPRTGSATANMGSDARLLVPILTIPELAATLRFPLSYVNYTTGRIINDQGQFPHPGQVLFHIRDKDGQRAVYTIFEVSVPTRIGSISIEPILVADGRFWLDLIAP